jgi:hypothetical protein
MSQGCSVITPENPLSPFCPVKSAGFESFQVEIECFCHGSSVEPNISRHLSKSKGREALQDKSAAKQANESD